MVLYDYRSDRYDYFTSGGRSFTIVFISKGHNSVPPEMWLLPNWFPFHPGRMWCHCRMVYLPMGYLYGSRFIYKDAETDPLIADLRKEVCNFGCQLDLMSFIC